MSEGQMPYAREAEEAVLSCLMQNPVGLLDAAMRLEPEDFYHPGNRRVFEVIADHLKDGKPVESAALTVAFSDLGELEKIGGPSRISEIETMVMGGVNFAHYRGVLRDKRFQRSVITTGTQLVQAGYAVNDSEEILHLVHKSQADLYNLTAESAHGKRWHEIAEVAHECVDRTQAMIAHRGHVAPGAVATGFTELDRRTMGLQPGELVIIGARPAMGKSALAMNMGMCIALGNGHYREFNQEPLHVGVVTCEMSRHELTQRELVGLSGVNLKKMMTGMLSRDDQKRYMQAASRIMEARMGFIDTGSLSIQELMALVRQRVTRHKMRVLVVDYVQRLSSENKRSMSNRNLEIADITSGLKQLAKDFGLVVIALAQVSREAERRPGCKPTLADLRESGDIEADADMVGLLYRPGYYARLKAKDGGEAEDQIADDRAELILAKYRRGSPEPIPLIWDGPRTQFMSQTRRLFSNNEEEREHE